MFPLDNSILPRLLAPKPSYTAGRTEFTYSAELSGMPSSDAPNILAKSYTITADVEVPEGGAEGMIVTDGGRFGGYGLYLLKGKPVFVYNFLGIERFRWEGKDKLAPGQAHPRLRLQVRRPRHGQGRHGRSVGGWQHVDRKEIPHTIPALLTIDESFDVGVDTRTGVDDADYQVPFRFTGKINEVKVTLVPPAREQAALLQKREGEARRASQ